MSLWEITVIITRFKTALVKFTASFYKSRECRVQASNRVKAYCCVFSIFGREME